MIVGPREQMSKSLLFGQGRTISLVYLSVLVISYLTIICSYPFLDIPREEFLLYQNNFIVFLILSIVLSVALLFVKSSYIAGIFILFRVYLIMIQGYSLEVSLLFDVIIGLGFLMEAGTLLPRPYNFIISIVGMVGMIATQRYLPFWGVSRYREVLQSSSSGMEVLLFGVVLFCMFLLILTVMNQIAKSEAMRKNVLLQEATLETLAKFNVDLQQYARHVDIESSDRERNRISRELHDISGYIFTNLIALLNAACSIPQEDRETLADILMTARNQAKEGLNETRIALRQLRNKDPIPQEIGLRAIYKIIYIFQQVTGLKVHVHWGNIPDSFSREINFALYRTIQEALTNTIRHSLATEISIYFSVKDSQLHVIIVDNGQGADLVVKGIGLTGMEERIGNLHGHIDVKNAVGGGFQLNVTIPIGAI